MNIARGFQHLFDRLTTQSSAREFRTAEEMERMLMDRYRGHLNVFAKMREDHEFMETERMLDTLRKAEGCDPALWPSDEDKWT